MFTSPQAPLATVQGKRAVRSIARGDTRKDLVWCGTELLTERGFQITGIDEVLKRVGVPKGSFYHYFKSKDDFGHAVIDNYELYYARKMDRIFGNTNHSPVERLRDFVQNAKNGMVKFDFKRGCLIGNLGQELAALDTEFRVRLESVLLSWERRVAGCLKEAMEIGELAPGQDPEALSRFFWVGWEGAILRAKLMRSLQPIDQFASIFFDSVLLRETPTPTSRDRS